jgi:hypothetical protein
MLHYAYSSLHAKCEDTLIYFIPQFSTLLPFLISFTFSSRIVQCVSCLLTRRDYYRFMLCLTSIIFLYSNSVHSTYLHIFTSCGTSITFLLLGLFISSRFRFDVNTLYFQLSFVLYYNFLSVLKRLRFTECFGNSDITWNVHSQELC